MEDTAPATVTVDYEDLKKIMACASVGMAFISPEAFTDTQVAVLVIALGLSDEGKQEAIEASFRFTQSLPVLNSEDDMDDFMELLGKL